MVENETGETWSELTPVLAKVKVGIHRTQAGEGWRSTTLTPAQKDLFRKVQAEVPPDHIALKTAKRQAV
ncbi:MAG: hypothetical protein RDU89_10365 [bacterium]|nr:hypothetical protein [bacterium]